MDAISRCCYWPGVHCCLDRALVLYSVSVCGPLVFSLSLPNTERVSELLSVGAKASASSSVRTLKVVICCTGAFWDDATRGRALCPGARAGASIVGAGLFRCGGGLGGLQFSVP